MKARIAWLFLLVAIAARWLLGEAATAAEPANVARPPNPFFAFDNGVGRDLKWSPAQQAATLKGLGYDGIGYTGTEDFAERQQAFRDHGLKIFSLYVACYVDQPEPYAPQLKAAIQQLKGTDVIVWLTVQGQATNDMNAVRIVREIAELAGAAGVRVALYPHKGFFVATAEDALRLVRQVGLPNLGVSLNLCHELAAGNAGRMEAIAKACGPQLFLVSLNGADPSGGWNELIQPLGKGSYDVAGFVRALRTLGYAGPIGLQCYNLKGDPTENLRRSIAAWREISRPDFPAERK